MYEKTIKCKDFFGNDISAKKYFNLSEAEVLNAQFDRRGDFAQLVQGIANTKDAESLGRLFREIIIRSYGEPSPDGIYFEKSDAIREKFENSVFYNALYTELLFDAEAASDFINHVIPVESIQKIVEKANSVNASEVQAPKLVEAQ